MSYEQYRDLISQLLSENKTTGPDQSEDMIGYTRMNQVRMKRLDKVTHILPEVARKISQIKSPQTWLIITEGWCGDAAQILPVVQKIAELNPMIETRYVLRDEHPELMDLFLTNGARSIPIIIAWDPAEETVLSHWGPRPAEMQQIVMDRKGDPNATPYKVFAVEVQKWYAQEKTLSIQKELTESLEAGWVKQFKKAV